MRVLVVDDQRSARVVLKRMLSELDGLEIVEAATLAQAQQAVDSEEPDMLLVDIRLAERGADRGGLELLEWLRATGRSAPAVMVTASTELAEIRDAMRLGAQDYVLKDELCPEMLLPIVTGIRERLALRGEVQALRRRVDRRWGIEAIVGSSPAMERARRLVARVADADAVVLVRGQTGTGKEVVARAIHESSHRSAEPFVAINCSAMPAPLVESLIFGHERGAFTNAVRRTRGQLELARGGTVLLDEVAEMPVELQAKLLRVLESRRFQPLGSEHEVALGARIVAATHVDLEERIAEGRFREDLYYRLNVVAIELPPLDERREDIPDLVRVFCEDLSRPLAFTADAIAWLEQRGWPGNARELRNAVERVALLSESDTIDAGVLAELVGDCAGAAAVEVDRIAAAILALPIRLGSKLEAVERAVLHHAIEICAGNKSAAARLIGVHRKALERRWERLSPSLPDEDDPLE